MAYDISALPRHDGRTALITGASKGIGYAAAHSLASEGCNVHIASRTATRKKSLPKAASRRCTTTMRT